MSIYSGFATRHQQQNYDQCLETVLYIMQKRLLKFYKGQYADQQKFVTVLNKLYTQMKSMESHKYLQPKSSNTFQQLLMFLKKKQLHDASVYGNKISQPQKANQFEINSKHPIVNIAHPTTVPLRQMEKYLRDSRQKSTRLNGHNGLNKDDGSDSNNQSRPKTTNNIRKRMTSKAMINQVSKKINQDCSKNDITEKQMVLNKQFHQQNYVLLNKGNVQNILNSSASKLVRLSRNEPRSYFNSNQAIRSKKKSTIKSKQKCTQENIQQEQMEQRNKQKDVDVRQLIKGYINKTKKSYIRGYNKRKQEMAQMLKFI